MPATAPFDLLLSLDQRCRSNASGMPVSKSVVEDWVGIGFKISNVPLLARMDDISEILPPPPTIRVPGVKHWVKGLANVRGSIMPVLDMKALLFNEVTKISKASRILIINYQGLIAGLLVEEVYGLRRFKPEDQRTEIGPDTGPLEVYLAGMFVDQVRQWNIFSIDKLARAEQFTRVV